MARRWLTHSRRETQAVGAALANDLLPDRTLLLYGGLGSGKTTLTQGIAEALGIEPHHVQSPTYTLINEHPGRRQTLVHVDLYRLSPEEIPALGLDEVLEGPGVKVVEWAERLDWSPRGALCLRLARGDGEETRVIEELACEAAPSDHGNVTKEESG